MHKFTAPSFVFLDLLITHYFLNYSQRRRSQQDTVQGASTVQLEIPGVGLIIRPQEQTDPSNNRSQFHIRGKAPMRGIRDRGDRETERVLGAIQNNLSLSGMAVGSGRYTRIPMCYRYCAVDYLYEMSSNSQRKHRCTI